MNAADLEHLRRAVDLAQIALEAGEEPVRLRARRRRRDGALRGPQPHLGWRPDAPSGVRDRAWAANHVAPEDRGGATVYTSGEHCAMCSAAHGWVGLGRIVIAASSEQLRGWAADLGAPPPRVASLPINAVVADLVVEGPHPEFASACASCSAATSRGKPADAAARVRRPTGHDPPNGPLVFSPRCSCWRSPRPRMPRPARSRSATARSRWAATTSSSRRRRSARPRSTAT